jgi:hypothetical protein
MAQARSLLTPFAVSIVDWSVNTRGDLAVVETLSSECALCGTSLPPLRQLRRQSLLIKGLLEPRRRDRPRPVGDQQSRAIPADVDRGTLLWLHTPLFIASAATTAWCRRALLSPPAACATTASRHSQWRLAICNAFGMDEEGLNQLEIPAYIRYKQAAG